MLFWGLKLSWLEIFSSGSNFYESFILPYFLHCQEMRGTNFWDCWVVEMWMNEFDWTTQRTIYFLSRFVTLWRVWTNFRHKSSQTFNKKNVKERIKKIFQEVALTCNYRKQATKIITTISCVKTDKKISIFIDNMP